MSATARAPCYVRSVIVNPRMPRVMAQRATPRTTLRQGPRVEIAFRAVRTSGSGSQELALLTERVGPCGALVPYSYATTRNDPFIPSVHGSQRRRQRTLCDGEGVGGRRRTGPGRDVELRTDWHVDGGDGGNRGAIACPRRCRCRRRRATHHRSARSGYQRRCP